MSRRKRRWDPDKHLLVYEETGALWPHWSDNQGLVEAQQVSVPLGTRHLHMLYDGRNGWMWTLRLRRNASICGTPRCVIVEINSLGRCP